jgi:hypothetical protein
MLIRRAIALSLVRTTATLDFTMRWRELPEDRVTHICASLSITNRLSVLSWSSRSLSRRSCLLVAAKIVQFARPNIQIYDARLVDLYQWAGARYPEGGRNKGDGGESVSQSLLKYKAFSTFLDQPHRLSYRRKWDFAFDKARPASISIGGRLSHPNFHRSQ